MIALLTEKSIGQRYNAKNTWFFNNETYDFMNASAKSRYFGKLAIPTENHYKIDSFEKLLQYIDIFTVKRVTEIFCFTTEVTALNESYKPRSCLTVVNFHMPCGILFI